MLFETLHYPFLIELTFSVVAKIKAPVNVVNKKKERRVKIANEKNKRPGRLFEAIRYYIRLKRVNEVILKLNTLPKHMFNITRS